MGVMTDRELAGGVSEGALEDEARQRQIALEEERDDFEEWLDMQAEIAWAEAQQGEPRADVAALRALLVKVAAEGARLHALLQETSR